MPTRTVLVSLLDQSSQPYQNAIITAILDKTDYDTADQAYVYPVQQVYRTDANGDATLTLWPNARGDRGSRYRVVAMTTGGVVVLDSWITVPDADGSLIEDIDEAVECAGECQPTLVDKALLDSLILASMNAHLLAADPHPQYASGGALDAHSNRTDNPHGVTAAQVGADPAGTTATHEARTDNPHSVTAAQVGAESSGAVAAHEAAANPHPQYGTGGAQDTHSGRTDNPHGVTAAQVGADAAGTAAAAVAAHEGAANPHAVYLLAALLNQANGAAGLNGLGKLWDSQMQEYFTRDGGAYNIDHANVLTPPDTNQSAFRRLDPASAGEDKLTLGDGTVVVPGDVLFFPWGGTTSNDWLLLSEGPPRIIEVTASMTITGEHKNAILRINSASDITLTLPQASTEALHQRFGFGVIQANTGAAIFAKEGAETLLIKAGMTKTNGLGAPAQVLRTGATEWFVGGDLA